MKKFAFMLILSAFWSLTGKVVLAFDASSFDTHTYTYTAELKPISNSFQLAKSIFLPDRFEDLGLSDYDTLHSDYNIGNCDAYPLTLCPSGTRCEACPFNTRRFRTFECVAPYQMSGGKCVCPPAVSLNGDNEVCSQYCGNTCIEKTCSPSPNQTGCTNGTQSCDNGCGQKTRQCCVACSNKVTSKPANATYTYTECYDGSNHQIQSGWTCNSGYHKENNSCEKDCVSNPCSAFTLSECPSGYTCTSCTKTAADCSTSGTYYQIIACPSGKLDLNNYWCNGALKCLLSAQ